MADSSERAQILIVGGGFAALEAALALKALAAELARLTIIAPAPVLRYRPSATLEAFHDAPARSYDLRNIAQDLGGKYHQGQVEAVEADVRQVSLASGARLSYDALVLAIGARAVASIPGALTFRDQRDVALFRDLLRELDAGTIGRLAFVVPPGTSWPLPLYELALLSATRAKQRRADVEVSLVSAEEKPLATFGEEASRLVADVLSEHGVRFLGRSVVTGIRRDGSLALQSDAPLRVDRVVAAPELRANRITGVPASWWGFVPVDSFGRVEGLNHVYAAGDMTTFPIKQGGLAAQQADRVAEVIAASLGAPVKELRASHVLQARLLGGERPVFLRAELDWRGLPTGAALEHYESGQMISPTKVFGRYLTPYLEATQPLAA